MADIKFMVSNVSKQWLVSNGFRYNRLFSNEVIEAYTYRFPVYKYEEFTLLECELRINWEESFVYIDVYDYNTINKYAPFYYYKYGDYNIMLKNIWKIIKREINRLGITLLNSMDK